MHLEPGYIVYEQFKLDRFSLELHLRGNFLKFFYHHRV